MHNAEQGDLSSDTMGTLLVTVQLVDETPAILLLHKFCSNRGFSYEWKTAQLHD